MHYIDAKCELVIICLDCLLYPGSHTAENICKELENLLKYYLYSAPQVIAYVADMANVMYKAIHFMQCNWHRCLAQLLALITKKLLQVIEVSGVFKVCKAIVGHFQSSSQAIVAAGFEINWQALVPDIVTHWWLTHLILVSFLHFQPALKGLMIALPEATRL